MNETIKTLEEKKEEGYLYFINRKNELFRRRRGLKNDSELVGVVSDLKQDPKFIHFISSNKEGHLTIGRAKRDPTKKVVKGLNWAKVED